MAKFKKILAGVLAAAMVLTAAPIASLNTQAAAKAITVNKTKVSVKVGAKATVKVTLKAASKKARKVTLKSKNAGIAKVAKKVTVKANKKAANFKITGVKAGSTVITVKYGKNTAKVKVTVKEDKFGVESVSLDNTTPKVGDTITAKVAPAKATGVSYQWLADDAVISGATSSTYTVAETDLGKQLSVTVKADKNTTATSAKTAKVEPKAAADIAVEAKQTHAKVVAVTYTKGSHSADSSYKVTKGSQEIKVASSSEKDGVVNLTLAENLTDGEFKVTVTTSAKKTAEATFTGAKPVLTEVKFKNNKLAVSANTTKGMVKGYAFIESTDQFGDHMNLTSPSFTVSKGDASFKADTGILTLDATSTTDGTYKLGEMVVVSVMYDNNTKVVPATLTVSVAAMAKTITFGDLTSDDTKAYPVDKITQTNLARGVYWFPVTEAIDDNDVALDVDRLNQMIDAGTVFVTPKDSTGTIIYADQFSEKTLKDGKKQIALVVKGGDQLPGLNAGVDMSLSVFSVGGAQATLPVKIQRDAVIKDLEIEIPELYIAKTCEIKFSAVDTDGNTVDLYKVTSNDSLATSGAAVGTGHATIANNSNVELRFWDTAKGAAVIGTKINVNTGSVNCDWEIVRNATSHAVSLKITPCAGQDEGYLNMTGTTAAYTAITKANIKINATRTIDGVNGFKSSIATKVLNTNATAQDLAKNTVLNYNDGSTVDAAGNAIYVVNDANLKDSASNVAAITLDKAEGSADATKITNGLANPLYVYSMEIVGKSLTKADGTDGTAAQNLCYVGNGFELTGIAATGKIVGATGKATLTVKRGAKTGASDTVKISLYKLSKSTDNTKPIKVELLGTKSVNFTVENEDTASYVIALDANDNIMYAGSNNYSNGDVLPISIKTAGGAAVDQDKLQSVKIVNKNNDGATFDYWGKGIHCTHESNADPGKKMTATIYAAVESNGDVVNIEKEFTYVTDQPVVTYTGVYVNAGRSVEAAGNAVSLSATSIGDGSSSIWLKYQDQYYTEASADGISVDVTVANNTSTAAGVSAVYDEEVVNIYGSGTIAAGKTIQFIINGGKPVTLYCTAATGGVVLGAAPITYSEIATATFGTGSTAAKVTGKIDAAAAGTVYLMTTANYNSWKINTNVPPTSITTGTIAEGGAEKPFTLTGTGLTASTDYYVVFQETASKEWTYEKVTTEAAVAYNVTLDELTSENLTSGNASTGAAVVKDQFGNAYTSAVSATTCTGGTAKVNEGDTATLAIDANGKVTLSVTDDDANAITAGQTFTFTIGSTDITATAQTPTTNWKLS